MAIERQDNTRNGKNKSKLEPKRIQTNHTYTPEQAQLYDGTLSEAARRQQDFYNYNAFGNGIQGYQTRIDPNTPEGQGAIQSNFDYAKGNAEDFMANIALGVVGEGVGQGVKYVTTSREIGRGAEQTVRASRISPNVTKTGTVTRSEIHARNSVPNVSKATYKGKSGNMSVSTQRKVNVPTGKQATRATSRLTKRMTKRGWRPITHPNLQGIAYTNGRTVVSDVHGNVGTTRLLRRPKLYDLSVQSKHSFRRDMR